MVFDCEKCQMLTPEYIERGKPHTLEWATKIGTLPHEWNHCVGYDAPNPGAKIVHYTAGIPCFEETQGCEYTEEWHREHAAANSTVPWPVLMGNSVHAQMVRSGHLQRKAA